MLTSASLKFEHQFDPSIGRVLAECANPKEVAAGMIHALVYIENDCVGFFDGEVKDTGVEVLRDSATKYKLLECSTQNNGETVYIYAWYRRWDRNPSPRVRGAAFVASAYKKSANEFIPAEVQQQRMDAAKLKLRNYHLGR